MGMTGNEEHRGSRENSLLVEGENHICHNFSGDQLQSFLPNPGRVSGYYPLKDSILIDMHREGVAAKSGRRITPFLRTLP